MTAEPKIAHVRIDGGIGWITLNNPPVNATSTKLRQELKNAIADVRTCRAAVIMCAGRTFVAGGDMTEFDAPAQEPLLPDVVQQIEDSATPFVAAMHGTVLGGGLEIAMACAWRIALPGTKFGLPEVNVGIIPGAGGSQRLPRLVGMEAAIEMACLGKQFDARKMLELGGIDVIADGDLAVTARNFLSDMPTRPTPVSERMFEKLSDSDIEKHRQTLTKRAKGQTSPVENLTALTWASLPFSEGQPKERTRHLELRNSPESRALRHAFFAERQVRKPAAVGKALPKDVNQIAVVGGGLMGAGIAVSALNAGFSVTMIERDEAAAKLGRERVGSLLDRAVARGKMTQETQARRIAAFVSSADYGAAKSTDLAIEAVFEDVEVKKAVFAQLANVMSPDAILATNTSYLDPTDIFAGIENPARCLGLHFFSPAHIMKLLEIIHLPSTAPKTLATGFSLAKSMGKTPVLSGICDGFIGNRMLAAYRRAADYLLVDGALPYQVDAAMREFGMPMGPYELQDLTGLQISWANRKRLTASRDPKERYVPFGDMLCEQGRFGQRSGRGWYIYDEGSRKPIRDTDFEKVIIDHSAVQGTDRRRFTAQDIQSRLMAVLANEGLLIVHEGIAENMAAVDTVQMSGYGFPRWRGGPMQYANEIGWNTTAENMRKVADASPGSWMLAPIDDVFG